MTIHEFLKPHLDGRPILISVTGGPEFVMYVLEHKDSTMRIAYNSLNNDDDDTNTYNIAPLAYSELLAKCEWNLIDYFVDNSTLKCECGAESIGVNTHSSWCRKASAA